MKQRRSPVCTKKKSSGWIDGCQKKMIYVYSSCIFAERKQLSSSGLSYAYLWLIKYYWSSLLSCCHKCRDRDWPNGHYTRWSRWVNWCLMKLIIVCEDGWSTLASEKLPEIDQLNPTILSVLSVQPKLHKITANHLCPTVLMLTFKQTVRNKHIMETCR